MSANGEQLNWNVNNNTINHNARFGINKVHHTHDADEIKYKHNEEMRALTTVILISTIAVDVTLLDPIYMYGVCTLQQ